ncbi:MAG: lysoplasmalogenase [Allomuricauda sp.]
MALATKKWHTGLNVVAFVSACLAMYLEFVGQRALYIVFKPLTTILIMSLLFFVPGGGPSRFRNIVLTALAFCLLGDILLLWEGYFVLGLASFLLAHLLFATGFIQLGGFRFHWISFLALLTIGGGLFLWLRPDLGNFLMPVTAYIIVIVFMAMQGVNLFLKNKKRAYAMIALAVLLFMFSDTMIAIDKFKSPFHWSGPIILGTYWLSIALIAHATFQIVSDRE